MPVIKWVHTENCKKCMKEVNIKPKDNLDKLQIIVNQREYSKRCNGCGILLQIKKVISNENCTTHKRCRTY
jgi:hypothetical protein